VTFGATGFVNRLGKAIANVTIGTNLRERQNVDAVTAKGVELTADVQLGRAFLRASYAYSNSEVHAPGSAFDGFAPAQSPRHAASATAGWATGSTELATTLRYVSRQYEDDLQTDALPGAVTVDAIVRQRILRGISLVGRAENIFDKEVVTRNAAGSIDLGTPRLLWLGISIER
jgi:iron complex outermembrane receptor protein